MKYSFVGEGEQELRLTPGDVITDVRSLPTKPGWSEGTLRGARAHFPDSMVEFHATEWYNEEVHVFLSQPCEWLYCRSCHQLLVEAQEMSCCEGMFCLKCIEQWTALEKGHCPGCATTEWRWHPSRTVERVLKGMYVLCRNQPKGCQWRGELRDLNGHLAKDTGCQYAVVCCPHSCGTDVMRLSLSDHISTQCSLRPFQCQYCQTRSTYADIIQNHLPVCPMHPVVCPNICGAEGVVRQGLAAHLSSCPLQSVECSNGCGVKVLRRQLEGHLMRDCLKRQVPCEYCKKVSSFEEIMGSHLGVCGHVPLDCPNKCSGQKILRQDLPDHIEKNCPLHVIGCEFSHVGCTARFSRRDREDHIALSQAAHLSLVMARMVHFEKRYDELRSSHEMLQVRCAALERQNEAHQKEYGGLLVQLKKKSEAQRLRNLEARRCELEHASRLPPPPKGVPRVFCVNNLDTRHWTTGPIHICNINVELIFNIHFQKLPLLSQKKVAVSLEGRLHHAESASPGQFSISFQLLHPEQEMYNVSLPFDVQVLAEALAKHPTYKVSCSPQLSTLIANTAHFQWERYMVNGSLYFRVTDVK